MDTIDVLLGDLSEFLVDRCKCCDTGWPEVSNEDMQRLNLLLRRIIDLKFERDCDGDSCIQVHLIDRTRYEGQHVPLIPHSHKIDNSDTHLRIDILHRQMVALRSMADKIDGEMRCLLMDLAEEKKKEL